MLPASNRVTIAVGSALIAFLVAGYVFRNQGKVACKSSAVTAGDSFGEGSGTSGKLFRAKKVREWSGSRLSRSLRASPSPGNRPAGLDEPCVCGGKGPWRPGGAKPRCAKWAVITTIFDATDLVKQLSQLEGWCTVVAGDKKGPAKDSYNLPNIVFLDVEAQEKLPYTLIKKLQWNHFSRKNVGFLFALEHGARIVFDCDDDNPMKENAGKPVPPPIDFQTVNPEMPAVDNSHALWNPYPLWNHTHFMWPRGYPLDLIRTTETQRGPATGKYEAAKKVVVLQSLADNDPDVDGIFRLTRPLPHFFASSPAAVALPEGVMAPYNAQACLFLEDALWSLLLPVTVHGRVSDIWRSYFTQRVLWWAGMRIAMAAPFVTQYRNAHNYLADFQSENPLYLQSGELVKRLNVWSPSSASKNVADVMEELIIDMYEHNIVEAGDVEATQAWIGDLISIGYKFPKKQKS